MKIAHLTDLHWFVPPTLGQMGLKRIIGSSNLYLMGRRHHFDRAVQQAAVAHAIDLDVDVVIITGDLTAQATQQEFDLAKQDLQPLLDHQRPVFIIPGNHDVYTKGAKAQKRMENTFGPWMHKTGSLGRLDLDAFTIIGLDPNRPTFLGAQGELPQAQLEELAQQLSSKELEHQTIVLALHYPVVDKHGALYDGPKHGLANAKSLVDVLGQAEHRPTLVLHGHEHHAYQSRITLADGATILQSDCGSSGQAYLPEKGWHASMNVYEWQPVTTSWSTTQYRHDGHGFVRVAPSVG